MPSIRNKTVILLAIPAIGALAPSQATTPNNYLDLVENKIVITSFPNSMGPARKPGLFSMHDYGFIRSEIGKDGSIILSDKANSWHFIFNIIKDDAGSLIVCLTDKANNGGSYLSITAVRLHLYPDGKYRSSGYSSWLPPESPENCSAASIRKLENKPFQPPFPDSNNHPAR